MVGLTAFEGMPPHPAPAPYGHLQCPKLLLQFFSECRLGSENPLTSGD